MNFRSAAIAIVATTLIAACSSFMQLPFASNSNPASPLGASSSSSSSDSSSAPDLAAQQDQLVKAYVQADTQTLKGQSKLAAAVGLKDAATRLDAEIKALNSGATQSSDDMKTADTVINDAQPQIDAKAKQKQTVSAEAKKTYAKGLADLALGVLDTYKLKDASLAFSKSVQGQFTRSPLTPGSGVNTKLSAGTYVARHVPGHLKDIGAGLQTSVSFAQSHGIPVPQSATDVLHQNVLASN